MKLEAHLNDKRCHLGVNEQTTYQIQNKEIDF